MACAPLNHGNAALHMCLSHREWFGISLNERQQPSNSPVKPKGAGSAPLWGRPKGL
jgi:hypothetical protein